MRTQFFIVLVLWLVTSSALGQDLKLNEWMVKNSTVVADQDGDFSDWVEIYNNGNETVNLSGFGISDDASDPYKWVFPTVTIGANEFLLVFCSHKDVLGPEMHTNFKLSDSDQLVLTDNMGYTLDSHALTANAYDISAGYMIDGGGVLTTFYTSTPGASNLNGVIDGELSASLPSGFYSSDTIVDLESEQLHEIRYTLDGSEPEISDPLWMSPFSVTNRTSEPNALSMIPTNAGMLEEEVLWEEPIGDVFKGTIIRARCFTAGMPSSHTLNLSYFVDPEGADRYSFSVVSILTDSLNLFDYDTGIYVPGLHHDLNPNGGQSWGTGNFHQSGEAWERRAHIQLFDENGALEFEQDLGLRIHGNGSRAYPQKSLRLYAREKYGESKIEQKVFDDVSTSEFEVLLLRNMGQDFVTGVAQDVLANELIKPLHQASLGSRPSIVFINGEYWGIQNIRERYDKHYLAQFHELDKDSIDIIDSYYGIVVNGSAEAFSELYNFMDGSDLSIQSNYDFVASKMDIEDFIDNTLTRIYLGCYDWPGNNMKMWRERSPAGRFRWLLLDNDRCIRHATFNTLEHATYPDNPGWPNPFQSTLFLRKLLNNDGFKTQFIGRMAELLNTSYDRDLVGVKLSELYGVYADEYPEHDNRWSALVTGETLEESYSQTLEIVRVRSCYVRQHFMEYFSLSESEFQFECDSSDLNLNISDLVVEQELSVFPNPNSGAFFLQLTNQNLRNYNHLTILDLSGKQVYSEELSISGQIISIKTSGLASGLYIVRLKGAYNEVSSKLVIQTE